MQHLVKKIIPYLSAVLIFLLISIAYLNPLLSGKKLQQSDITHYIGMSKEIKDFRQTTGEEPLWTNAMFGGMPAYQISTEYPANLIKKVDNLIRSVLPRPADYVFISMLGFFILLIALGVNPWLSIIGAIGFAFSSYFFIILEAGHNSKAHAIAYMAPVIGSFLLAYRKKMVLSAILTSFFVALQIATNHLQITYYLIYILIFLGIGELVHHIVKNKIIRFAKVTGLLLIAGLLAAGPSITNILLTNEYSKYTIRGKSELTHNEDNQTNGLDKDYATQWSYGKQETFTLMIPNAKGGASGMLGDAVNDVDISREYKQAVAQQNHYWGNQPFTSGPVYTGAIIFFLFIFGMFILKDHIKWSLLTVTLLAVFLSWGHNMMWFTDFFLEYVPGYNKFRTVSMTLVIAELTIPLIAMLGLFKIFQQPELLHKKQRAFYISLGLTAGLALIFYLMPRTFFDFLSQQELAFFKKQQVSNPQSAAQLNIFMDALESVRVSIFKADAIRTVIFILLGAGTLRLYALKKINKSWFLILLGLLITIDMWSVNKRYLNNDDFERARKVENPYRPTLADKQILKDKDPNFRVFNTTVSTFQDASTSYFHKSIGGYHGAKLRRYQELIDHYISKGDQNVLNMLNTKYFIVAQNNQPQAQRNPGALGNAWFVADFRLVNNADEEIKALQDFDPARTAIVDKRFSRFVEGKIFRIDSTASISLTSYAPNKLIYKYSAKSDQLAVFSEIYYPLGWQATIDGKKAEHFRVNYVLRAMVVPQGSHEIVFTFHPESYYTGEKIALASSLLLLILVVGVLGWELKKWIDKNKKAA